ncbi:MAG TPA: biotin/lipoyl-containing protein [Bryobacteraceae bacterium]|nr:biotin/lipoyl-containing protein [Bryobacteraceae bacterium]
MKFTITINNKTYEVDVEAAEPEAAPRVPMSTEPAPVRLPAAPVTAAPKPADSSPVNEEKVARSPVSGIVVRATAQVGQVLQVGDVLLVLEAMKMETSVTSPIAGKIKSINVAPGESVQNGQVVVEFE